MDHDPNDQEAKRWNYRPSRRVALNPLFEWPVSFKAVIRWYAAYWLEWTTTSLALILAVIAFFVALPPLDAMKNWEVAWMIRVWLANLIPHAVLAGSLHYWLNVRKAQGMHKKFDFREQARDTGVFAFRHQVYDNAFWSLASGVTLWSIAQILVYWAMANGYAPRFLFPENPVWFVLMFPFLVIWASFHFYWVHRALHIPWLYRLAHALHHRNVNVGPWSGISMHPIEHLMFYSNFVIHLIVPSHPIHVLFHGYMQSIHPIFSHSGFEKLSIAQKDRAQMGDFFHQLHHRYFECNYGTVEMPWDRWFGSFHDGSDKSTIETRVRKSKMHQSR